MSLSLFYSILLISTFYVLISSTYWYKYIGDGTPMLGKIISTNNSIDTELSNGTPAPEMYKHCTGSGIDELCQYGEVKPNTKYFIVSTTISGARYIDYAFNLPVAAQVWHRIGYDAIVVVVGDAYECCCEEHTKAQYILETLQTLDFVVLVVLKGVPANHSVMLSQSSRMFGASLVRDVPDGWNSTYIVTSDADMWLINKTILDLPEGKDITHGLISMMTRFGRLVPYVPMSYVGMRVQTWLDVMTSFGIRSMPTTPSEILSYFKPLFGDEAESNVIKATHNWYMDQRMMSQRIAEWSIKDVNRTSREHYYHRKVTGRISRPSSCPFKSLDAFVDIHVPFDLYKPERWSVMRKYLQLMFSDNSTLEWLDCYANNIHKYTTQCFHIPK